MPEPFRRDRTDICALQVWNLNAERRIVNYFIQYGDGIVRNFSKCLQSSRLEYRLIKITIDIDRQVYPMPKKTLFGCCSTQKPVTSLSLTTYPTIADDLNGDIGKRHGDK